VTSPFLNPSYDTGSGTRLVPTPDGLLGGAQNMQALPEETAGLTPEAAALAAQQLKALQLEDMEKRRRALRAMFGEDFPLAEEAEPDDNAWTRWAENRWEMHRAGVSQNILWAERNRLFRAGQQHLSPYGSSGVWRPAPAPKDAVRIIDNRIRPSLSWALEVLAEQRPGWRFQPTNTDADRQKKAEAQQRATEYQYSAQNMRKIMAEMGFWAQTDGVSFAMTYWDAERGPWEELESGKPAVPLGDCGTRVYRIEQVRVSSEATSSVAPMYWICRDIMPKQQAVSMYGPDIVDAPDQQLLAQQTTQLSQINQFAYTPLYQNQDTVARYTCFCEKSQWLPEGMTVIIVGKKVIYGPRGLLMGRVPMVRLTDGSEDPNFYPTPKMNTLIPPQMRINQLLSKWYESIRKNSGGRYATKTGAVSAETLIGGEVSMLEVRTTGDIRESLMPVQGFSVGSDIKEALRNEIKIIEDQTGYNDQARGQFTSDQSGRAILAIREQLERVFAPFVGAMSDAMTEWAKQTIGWMRFGYQMPRQVAVMGNDRSDLAVALSTETLDGVVDISVDPETLVPQPKALKQWILDNAYDRKLLTKEQWLDRSPIGDVRDMQSPDKVQYDKGMRVVEQILLGQPQEPIVWQDNESIQQSVLDKELILNGQTDQRVRADAQKRWQALAQQAQKKAAPPKIDPNSPAGKYNDFLQKIQNQAVATAESVIVSAMDAVDYAHVEHAALMAASGMTPPSGPQGPAGGPPMSGPPMGGLPRPMAPQGGQGLPQGRGMVKGTPPDARVAPIFGGGVTPSVAAAPLDFANGAASRDLIRAAGYAAPAPQ
jgi:hypothetical protein